MKRNIIVNETKKTKREIEIDKEWQDYLDTGLYFVGTMRHIRIYPHWTKDRVRGWYKTLKEAETAILENNTDLYECEYNYAIIEKVPHGVCPIGSKVISWYKWNGNCYKKTRAPKWSKGICNWTVC